MAKERAAPKRDPKLTDEERHKRFVQMAKEVEASNEPKDFDLAFERVVKPSDSLPRPSAKRSSS
jgi:hypothetical protein